jgi:predicted  nucleic acid-binding Zn-ribbon protein
MKFLKQLDKLYDGLEYLQDIYNEEKQARTDADDEANALEVELDQIKMQLSDLLYDLKEAHEHNARLEQALHSLGGNIE